MTTELYGYDAGRQMAAMDQAKVDEQSAMIRVHDANAQTLETKNKQAELMFKMLSEPDPVPPPPGPQQVGEAGGYGPQAPADQMAKAGHPDGLDPVLAKLSTDAARLAKAGFLSEAEAAAKAVEGITLKRVQESTAASQGAYRDSQVFHERMSTINALVSGVTDEASFNAAKMAYMSDPRFRGQPVPPALQAWTPDTPRLIAAIRNGTKEGLAKIASDRLAAEADSKDELRKAREDFMTWREGQAKIIADLKERVKKAQEKAGADVGAPTKGETDLAVRLLSDEYKEAKLPPAELSRAADDIASRAKAIRKANPGLDAATSTAQAFEEFKPGFATTAKAWYELGGASTTYKRKTGNTTPQPLPATEAGYVVGQTYTLRNGKPGKWTGQGFTLVEGQ
jgi:hypothetical protein